MSAYTSGVANSISASKAVIISTTDASDGYVSVDFDIDIAITILVQVVNTSGTVIALTGAVITQASNGLIRVASGGAYTVTATDIMTIFVSRPKI